MKPPYDKYEISNLGKVRNTKTNYYFSSNSDESGYQRISLSHNNKSKSYMIHRLVCEYFSKEFDDKLYVNHIDGNRGNNDINNLECVTIKENNNKKIFPKYGLKKRAVCQYDKNFVLIKIWERVKDIIDVSKKGIFDALKNGNLYKGYYWKYKQEIIKDEIWKNIHFNNSLFTVSNFGRIKLKSGKLSYGVKNESGYYDFEVGGRSIKAHRLVCMAFKPIENYDKMVVNHIDYNRSNNKIENLEWVTQSENTIHSYKNRKKLGNVFKRPVIRIDKNNKNTEYESLEMAAKMNNIKNKGNIVLVCQNKRKTSGGFKWKYKN